jgi:hypothetical protein
MATKSEGYVRIYRSLAGKQSLLSDFYSLVLM